MKWQSVFNENYSGLLKKKKKSVQLKELPWVYFREK